MRLKESDQVTCDVLIVGGGGAGLRAAIEARERGADVLVVSKSRVGYVSNTYISKAAVSTTGWGDPEDDPQVHLKDTVVGGRYLNDQALVAVMAQGVGPQISFLERCGVHFSKVRGKIRVVQAAGHSFARHVHAEHRVGSELIHPLKDHAKRIGVRFRDRTFITRLFSSGGRIAGAAGVTEDGSFQVLAAKCVILATGGYGHIYLRTNNAPGITGDGQTLAFELGAPLKDMEFVQFYPTATGPLGRQILLYEVFVLVAGARLKNSRGEDILLKHGLTDPVSLTRDRLARTIMFEINEGRDVRGGVVMDLSSIGEGTRSKLHPLFPSQRSRGRKEFIVSPTTHFCMGGLVTNLHTETSLPGLFGAGEVCAGVHGANRLAGNALAEVFTLGRVAGRKAAETAKESGLAKLPQDEITRERARLENPCPGGKEDLKGLTRRLKEVMWNRAGIVRQQRGLEEALEHIEEIRALSQRCSIEKTSHLMRYLELQNMLLVSEMACKAALMRRESRGSHYRSEYPNEDNERWLKNIEIRKGGSGMKLQAVPVKLGEISPGEVDRRAHPFHCHQCGRGGGDR